MGLLDFQNYQKGGQSRVGQPAFAGQAAPQGTAPFGPGYTAPAATGSYVAPGKASIPSLSGAIFNSDHNPSLYGAIESGDVGTGDWWLKGGPSVSAGLSNKAQEDAYKATGIRGASFVLGRALGIQDKHYDPLQTASDPTMNYGGYFQANPGVQAEWDHFSDKEKNGLFQGDPNNYAAWHYDNFGKGEGRTLSPYADIGAISAPMMRATFTPGQQPTLANLRSQPFRTT